MTLLYNAKRATRYKNNGCLTCNDGLLKVPPSIPTNLTPLTFFLPQTFVSMLS